MMKLKYLVKDFVTQSSQLSTSGIFVFVFCVALTKILEGEEKNAWKMIKLYVHVIHILKYFS